MAQGRWEEVQGKLTLITAWARNGLTNEDICKNLGINVATLYRYKLLHSELCDALKEGKEVVDIAVENKLFQLTQGYRYDEVVRERTAIYEDGDIVGYEMVETKRTTKEVLPNVTAQIFWLKNRVKESWRDKRESESTLEVRVPMLDEVRDTFKTMRALNSAEVLDIEA